MSHDRGRAHFSISATTNQALDRHHLREHAGERQYLTRTSAWALASQEQAGRAEKKHVNRQEHPSKCHQRSSSQVSYHRTEAA